MATFGDRLRLLRKKKELSMAEFAKIMNAGKTTISNWENDNRFPDRDTLIKLADYFNVSLDYLIGRTEKEHAIVQKENLNGKEYEFEIDKNIYPDGLTKEDLLEKLDMIKKLEEAGFKLTKDK